MTSLLALFDNLNRTKVKLFINCEQMLVGKKVATQSVTLNLCNPVITWKMAGQVIPASGLRAKPPVTAGVSFFLDGVSRLCYVEQIIEHGQICNVQDLKLSHLRGLALNAALEHFPLFGENRWVGQPAEISIRSQPFLAAVFCAPMQSPLDRCAFETPKEMNL